LINIQISKNKFFKSNFDSFFLDNMSWDVKTSHFLISSRYFTFRWVNLYHQLRVIVQKVLIVLRSSYLAIVLLENRNYSNVFLLITSKLFFLIEISFDLNEISVGARYSTYAVNIFKHTTKLDGKSLEVEFWDTGLYINKSSFNLRKTFVF